MSQTVPIETDRVRSFETAPELPLARDAGRVASVFEDVPKRPFAQVEFPEPAVVSETVPTRHDLHSGWSTQRQGMTVGEANTCLG
jgi:hypothetical protein